MPTIAVGDIHGEIRALDRLLLRLEPEIRKDDTLVFLGDVIDRGPNSMLCVERIIQCQESLPCRVVALLGNHEDAMLTTMGDYYRHTWALGMDAWPTISSYSPDASQDIRRQMEEAGLRLVTEKVWINYDAFFDSIPAAHMMFFQQMKLFEMTADVVCVHAGVDPTGGPLKSQSSTSLLWGAHGFPERYWGETPIVYGHRDDVILTETGCPLPRVGCNRTFGIDSISHGVLTAMRFPDGAVFQVNAAF